MLRTAVIILFFALIRFQLRDCPLERDEGEYAYAGQLILQGVAPYQLVYSMKLPGTFAAYSLILAVFGQTPGAIHLGLLFINAATTLLVFLLARRLFGHSLDRSLPRATLCCPPVHRCWVLRDMPRILSCWRGSVASCSC